MWRKTTASCSSSEAAAAPVSHGSSWGQLQSGLSAAPPVRSSLFGTITFSRRPRRRRRSRSTAERAADVSGAGSPDRRLVPATSSPSSREERRAGPGLPRGRCGHCHEEWSERTRAAWWPLSLSSPRRTTWMPRFFAGHLGGASGWSQRGADDPFRSLTVEGSRAEERSRERSHRGPAAFGREQPLGS